MFIYDVDLYDYFKLEKEKDCKGILTVYRQADYTATYGDRKRPAMIVFPGGGYHFCSNREKECIALKFLAEGFDCFVLDYSVRPVKYPAALIEAAMSVIYVRENAKELQVNAEKVAVIGFSAGGHLAGCMATIFDNENIWKVLGNKAELARPDAAILSYAVLSSEKGITHENSMLNLLGDDEETRKYLSIDKRVTERSVPAFIWHTVEDKMVPVKNSLLIAAAYQEAKVPFELHIFERGAHGISLATLETANEGRADVINPETAEWLKLAVNWLRSRGFVINR